MHRVGLLRLAQVIAFWLSWAPLVLAAQKGEDASEKAADSDPDRAVLYTIAPGPTTFERWGHTLLCFQPESVLAKESSKSPESDDLTDTSCFDFGIFPRIPLSSVVSGSLRGEPLFVPRELPYQTAVGRYWLLDRTVQRHVLPLSPDAVFDLRDRVDMLVMDGEGYAYHPFFNNCSVRVRDLLNEFGGEELERSAGVPDGPSLREIAERGFSGRALSLMGVELLVGSSADAPSTAWQRAAFPRGLAQLVERGFHVRPEVVYEQNWKPLPTSVHAGRVVLVLLALALSGALYFVRKRSGVATPEWRRLVSGVAIFFGFLGLLTLALRFYSAYPEFASSWSPLVLFPVDAALPFLPWRMRHLYLRGRLVLLLGLVALSALSIIGQPILVLGLFVILPFATVLYFETQASRPASLAPSKKMPAGNPQEFRRSEN